MFTIYIITCRTNGKPYVGQTRKTIQQRFSAHKSKARNGFDNCYKLTRAIRKYGEDNFHIEKIVETETEEKANELETYYIKLYNSVSKGYNVCPYGSAHPQTEETKNKLSKIKTGVPLSEQHKLSISQNHSKHFLGKKHTDQSKQLISEHNNGNTKWLGKHHTDETKIKMSNSKIGLYNGENNPFYGKTHSEEVKRIISEANKNKIISDETRQKLSIKSLGENNVNAKLTQEKVNNIKQLLSENNLSSKEISILFGVARTTISAIKCNKIWK